MTPQRRRLLALVLVWTLPSVLFATTTAFVYAVYRIDPPVRLADGERTAVIASLRAAVDDRPAIPCTVRAPLDRTLVVTVWSKGKALARIDGHGPDVGVATDDASVKLRTSAVVRALPAADRELVRLQVDVITGTAPLGGVERYAVPGIAEMLAINPGIEGIGTDVTGTRIVLLPNELVAARVLAAKRPSNAMPDFAMGIDMKRITAMLTTRAKIGEVARTDLFRFRTDTFVEQPLAHRTAAPVQLYRGMPAAPKLSAKTLREAALSGGRFLVSHLAPNGRYIYEHELSTGQQTDPMCRARSMPRHAGTTYFLAELYRITKEEWLREPIERAFKHLADLLKTGKCGSTLPNGTEIDCVLDRTEKIAHLGSTALTVVALAEYQRATGDTTYLPMAKKFSAWILWMQRSDGSFRHLYDPAAKKASEDELLYYSGEAALALARMHVVTGDPIYATAAEKALDWLVHWYDFFMGGFFYGEEHWTCIAAEAAWPSSKNPEYKEFCHGYGKFLRDQQPALGEHPDQDDYAGAYNFTSFVPPYNTPAGSRTEAMISSYLLGRHHGTPDPEVRDQIRAALQYTLGQQIRPESEFNVVGSGLGGMPGSPIDRNVRIDFVQHVCSAMIRASEWIDGPPHGGPSPQGNSPPGRGGEWIDSARAYRAWYDVTAVAEDKRTKIGSTGPQLAQRGTPAPAAGTPAPIVPSTSVSSNHPTSYLPPSVDPLIGVTLVGRYLIQKKLGEGGMGAVYLATHNLLDKQVALKILHTEFSRKQDLVERFMQEAKSASRIRHENVIDISDFGTTPEGLVFFAMELLKGHDLHEEVARARLAGELLPWVRSKKIFLQICSALVAAHSHGIIHRDLKPENVYLIDFLGEPDFVKLLDFGIAKLTEVDEGGRKLTKTGMLFGTPEYMSPEQARGENVDHRVDVYAMGCILFQLVTGKVPFEAENFMGVLSMHLTEPPPAIPVDVFDRIGAPRELAGVIDKALLKDRNQRWNTILELANAVRQISGDPLSSGLTGHAIPTQSSPRVAAPASTTSARQKTQWTGNVQVPTDEDGPGRGKSKLPLIIGGLLLAAGAAAAAVFAMNGRSNPNDTTDTGTGSAGGGSQVAGTLPQVPVTPPDAAVAAPPPENLPPLPAQVKVKLSSKPKGAKVIELSADGQPRRTYPNKTPLTLMVPGSRERQSFAISLAGYGDTIVDLIPDKDLEYTVTLEKGEAGAAPKRQIVPAGPVTTPGPGSATTPPDVIKPPDAGSASKPPDAGSASKPPDMVKPDAAPETKPPAADCPDPPCEELKPFNAGSGG